jgi:hypothetical protein
MKSGKIKDAVVGSAASNLLEAQNALIPQAHTSRFAAPGQRWADVDFRSRPAD